MNRTFSTLFSGGELAGIGMQAAGWQHLWGVEFVAEIAAVAVMNGFHNILVEDVRFVDFARLERPNHLHASPVCKNASIAKAGGKETEWDIECAQAICRAIRLLKPRTFTLENVYGYRKFQSYKIICECLNELGYWWEQHHLNAADFGTPQTRKRLFVRATQSDHLQPLPAPTRWIGWYEAIKDLIPALPETKFAEWQIRRLPVSLKTVLIDGRNTRTGNTERGTLKEQDSPAFAVTAGDGCGRHRAFLADDNPSQLSLLFSNQGTMDIRSDSEPATTVVATSHQKAAMPKALLVNCVHSTDAELTHREPEEPAHTITASCFRREVNAPKALLVDGDNAGKRGPIARRCSRDANTVSGSSSPLAFIVEGSASGEENRFDLPVRTGDEPVFTIHGTQPQRAILCQETSSMEPRRGHTHSACVRASAHGKTRAWVDGGKVVSMTPRCLARFMGLPDSYILPENKRLAVTIIGNGVCPPVMQRIAESLDTPQTAGAVA